MKRHVGATHEIVDEVGVEDRAEHELEVGPAEQVLDIRVTIAVNDSGTVTVVEGAIAHAEMLLTVKG